MASDCPASRTLPYGNFSRSYTPTAPAVHYLRLYRAFCVGSGEGTGKGGEWSSRPSQMTFMQVVPLLITQRASGVWASVVNECGCPACQGPFGARARRRFSPRAGRYDKPHNVIGHPELTPHAHSLRKSRIALFFEHLAQRESFLSQSQGSQWSHISHLRYPLLFGLSGSACGPGPPSSSESEHALTHGSSSLLDSGSGSEMFCICTVDIITIMNAASTSFSYPIMYSKSSKSSYSHQDELSFRRTHTHYMYSKHVSKSSYTLCIHAITRRPPLRAPAHFRYYAGAFAGAHAICGRFAFATLQIWYHEWRHHISGHRRCYEYALLS